MMLFRVVVVYIFLLSVNAITTDENDSQKIIEKISSALAFQNGNNVTYQSLCGTYSCCNINPENKCSISEMTKDKSTLVFPGGETRCIYSYSTPYAFQVIPGSTDKVLFYFQSGGACWDRISNKMSLCTSNISPQSLQGVFSRDLSKNLHADYTVIHAMYCSGDVWAGNVTQTYNDDKGIPITQKGIINAQAALDWLVEQQANGFLASELSMLSIMGSSAGSLGAQVWTDRILSTVKHTHAVVVPDSYVGVFPPNTAATLMYDYGLCASGLLSLSLTKKCNAKTIAVQDIMLSNLRSYPQVPFAFIQSKIDDIQQLFFVALGVTLNSTQKVIIPTEFYLEVNKMFAVYNRLPNFITYLVDGDKHCFTPESGYYESDGVGYSDNNGPLNNNTIMLSEWMNQLVDITTTTTSSGNSNDIQTGCVGEVKTPSPPTPPKEEEDSLQSPNNRNSYCSSLVFPKTLQV
mmetsp:Transcript_2400/g.3684  ORF Transcript_2400/g.3684 Transcript_2400/m.3684 type:complete len:462 (-) Transcript_2400:1413-2798(-)